MKWIKKFMQRPLVGLDIGVSGIKAVELQTGNTPRLVGYNRIPLPWGTLSGEGEILERDTLITALKKLFDSKSFTTRRVAVGLSGNSIITKKVAIAQMKPQELREQLYWEAEQYIPFNVNDVNLDFAILGPSQTRGEGNAPMMDVLIVAAKKDYVQSMVTLIEEAGLQPSVLDAQAFALGNAFEFNYGSIVDTSPGGATNVIIDFGAGATKISVVEGDKTSFTRELRQSGIGCTRMISERLGIDLTEAEKLKIQESEEPPVAELLTEYVSSMVDEVSRSLDFAITHGGDQSLQGIYVCGGASRTSGLIQALEEKMAAPVQALNAAQSISGSGRKMNTQAIREVGYLGAVAIGLSLRTSGDTA